VTGAQYLALACTSPWWASLTAFALYGLWTLARRAARAAQRAAVWLRQSRATAQPDLTEPAVGRATVPPARRTGRIYLTDRAANRRAAALDRQLPADLWKQLAPLYLTPEEPTR
jgi:hypothetical protein